MRLILVFPEYIMENGECYFVSMAYSISSSFFKVSLLFQDSMFEHFWIIYLYQYDCSSIIPNFFKYITTQYGEFVCGIYNQFPNRGIHGTTLNMFFQLSVCLAAIILFQV